MYDHITIDAASQTARFRMPVLCPEMAAETFKGSLRTEGAVSFGYGAALPASFQDATTGVRAWSPPV